MIDNSKKLRAKEALLPELEKLVEQLPQYGEICLKAKICDFKLGTIFLGIEIAKRIPKSNEGV